MRISKRDKRFLQLGLLAVLLFIFSRYILIPFYQQEISLREEIEGMELTYEQYKKILLKKDDIEKQLSQIKQKKNKITSQFLRGDTPALAAAELQRILEQIAKSSEVKLKRVRVRDSDEVGEFLSIPIEVRMTTDLQKVTKFLEGIKNSNKFLYVGKLKISVKNRRDPKSLIVTMTVNGLIMEKA
jgi:Tfp pilus assembly protein PilO